MALTERNISGAGASPASRPRLLGLDAFRFLAAISIIWLHASDVTAHTARFRLLSVFAVPFFAASAAMFAVRKGMGTSAAGLGGYVRGRLFRLYVPFFVWSAVYLVLRNVKHLLFHLPPLWPSTAILISGASGHLWFLPFIAAVTILAYIYGLAVRMPNLGIPFSALVLVLAFFSWVVPCPIPYHPNGLGFLASLSFRALPSALLGVVIGQHFGIIQRVLGKTRIIGWSLLAVSMLLLVNQVVGGESVWQENLAGVFVLLASLTPDILPGMGVLAPYGELAYGVYLVHIAFLQFFEALLDRNHRADVPWWQVFVAFGLTAVLSTLAAAIFRRWRFTAWMIGSTVARKEPPA